MYDLIKYHIPEAIRIEVLRIENANQCLSHNDEEVRKFSVDPQITPLSVLQSFLVRAFNLHSDFSLSYFRRDSCEYSPIESDIDLDSAYLKHSEPVLRIRMSVYKNNSLPDWDVITISDVARTQTNGISIANALISQVEKFMGRAFDNSSRNALTNEMMAYPLNDNQFRNLLDKEGKVRCSRELRIAVYRRGVDPSLRKVVWKHLLQVYPPGLTAQQRIDFIKLKCETYIQMRNLWQSNTNDQTVEQTLHMVRKDVMRTDRCHHYYRGSSDDDNDNVTALLNILTTFALNHKDKYCQGMSDLASPLLYAMKDEAHAYICFCALMTRLSDNFNSNGESMSRKFANLTQLLQYYDPEFYSYLRIQGAHELLFCYRWILLELKREFPFDDTLHMLEVLWSSIPPSDITSLRLFDDSFLYIPNKIQQMKPKFRSDVVLPSKTEDKPIACKSEVKPTPRPRSLRFMPQFLSTDSRDLDSPDEDEFAKNLYRCPPPRNCLVIDKQFSIDTEDPLSEPTENVLNNNLKETKTETSKLDEKQDNDNTNKENLLKTLRNVHCNGEYNEEEEDISEKPTKGQKWSCPIGLARSVSCESLKAEKTRTESYGSQCSELGSSFSEMNTCSTKSSSCSSLVILSSECSSMTKSISLLSPDQLGSNDAFMLFLCLTILLQNRDKIISNNLDANDIQMYFDGLVRKNDVVSVLDFARQLFHSYLSHWHQDIDSRT